MDETDFKKLAYALQTLLDPAVDSQIRTAAINLCETYKNHQESGEIGFRLASDGTFPPTVRYFGWQLVKHTARLKWTDISDEQKLSFQNNLLSHLSSCAANETQFVKSAIASCLCEVVKHVWPQQWPDMLPQVFALCQSKSSTAVVQGMLLGLVEDVVLYQTVSVKSRSKELRQALTFSSPEVLNFLCNVINEQLEAGGERNLIASSLKTIAVYLEWINVEQIFADNGDILNTLFLLLHPNFEVNVAAAECILTIASRKGAPNERKIILKLTDDKVVAEYVKAICAIEQLNEDSLAFLKTISKCLSLLVGHVVHLWQDKDKNAEFPQGLKGFACFLSVVFDLARHESRVVAHSPLLACIQLLRHQEIRKDASLLSSVPQLLVLVGKHLSKNQTNFTHLEQIDFGGDEDEMSTFAKQFRSTCIDLLRACAVALPIDVVNFCLESVHYQLATSPDDVGLLESSQTFSDTVLGCVVGAAAEKNKTHMLPIRQAEQLLHTYLSKTTDNYEVQKILLTSAYSLCKLVALSSDPCQHFQLLCDRAFAILDETRQKQNLSSVCSLRRQVGVILVRIAKYHPTICLPMMDYLKGLILQRLGSDPLAFSTFEKVSMFESLILISNEWKNFEAQSGLIKDILETTSFIVNSPELASAIASPLNFARAIGLCAEASDTHSQMRSDIYYLLTLTLAVLTRSQVPSNHEELQFGGFYQNEKVVQPCGAHIGRLIELAMTLNKIVSLMWSPEVSKETHPNNARALHLRDCEKKSLVCKNPDQVSATSADTEEQSRPHWERIQIFLIMNLSNCHQIVGCASKSFPDIFYSEQILQVLEANFFNGMATLPVLRLKSLIRMFLVPYLKNCPSDKVETAGNLVLVSYCGIMTERLAPMWKEYEKKESGRINGCGNGTEVEDKPDEEIIEEQLLRTLSREHLDLLVSVCVNKNPPTAAELAGNKTADEISVIGGGHLAQLTEFGAAITTIKAGGCVFTNALEAMSWHDTTSCFKATQIMWPLLKVLLRDQPHLFLQDLVALVFRGILRGLCRHGEHEGCEAQISSLVLMVIQALPNHKQTFLSVLTAALPNADQSSLGDFIAKFPQSSEKHRKATFKKLTSSLIERHVSQQFKEVPKMNSLGPLFEHGSRNKRDRNTDEHLLGVASLFQPSG